MVNEPNGSIRDLTAKEFLFDKSLIYVFEDEKIQEVEKLMIKKGIGGVPVVSRQGSKKEVIGMLTQRDIILAKASLPMGGMLVRDLMSHDVVCVSLDAPLIEILGKMKENNIARVPVVDQEDSIVGMIVHKNILKKIYDVLKE